MRLGCTGQTQVLPLLAGPLCLVLHLLLAQAGSYPLASTACLSLLSPGQPMAGPLTSAPNHEPLHRSASRKGRTL